MNRLIVLIFTIVFSISAQSETLPFGLKFGMDRSTVKSQLASIDKYLKEDSPNELIYDFPPTEIGEVSHLNIHFQNNSFAWLESPLTDIPNDVYPVKLMKLAEKMRTKSPPGFVYTKYGNDFYVATSSDQIIIFDFRERRDSRGLLWVNDIVYGKKFSGDELLSNYMKLNGITNK
ncbi:hypothetical protein SODG_005109 [Sodalis praecaptivus]